VAVADRRGRSQRSRRSVRTRGTRRRVRADFTANEGPSRRDSSSELGRDAKRRDGPAPAGPARRRFPGTVTRGLALVECHSFAGRERQSRQSDGIGRRNLRRSNTVREQYAAIDITRRRRPRVRRPALGPPPPARGTPRSAGSASYRRCRRTRRASSRTRSRG